MSGGYIHLDGNRLNNSADNLFFATTEELRIFHKSRYEKLTAEYTKAMLLKIRLDLKIKAAKKIKNRRD